MPRINLLPWREEDRQRRQREFMVAMAGSFVAGLLVVVMSIVAYSQMIDNQKNRNERLETEILKRVDYRGSPGPGHAGDEHDHGCRAWVRHLLA